MQQAPRKQLLWTSLYISWILILVWLSMTSTPSPLQLDISYEDKINHALAYAMLAFLGERAWRQWSIVGRAWLWSLVVALFFGAAMEVAQMALTSVRVAEWGDWIADGVGAGLALALNGFWHKKSRQES